ncbi:MULTISPECIES: hypothetical protein [unclassified Variovorax]|uniref:hypothetical protein n=1 Tax=unclassified Variovorax TaxID=663243 RepID=UPI000837DCB0|nr:MULTISPECIES: hypothetical protein [unclassified Variovorax]PNG50141.1 hypothetical protein CHC06_05764 [Variovorax sp. B2]PNG51014.1 hypothetical protein CHC07_05670 [Variovorax sp. B4]VTV17181.1 hypothetical protein WDL1P1_00180 [Variovorax sp. WDL1]
MIEARALDPTKVRDIAPLVLDEGGRLKVMPAAFYEGTTVEERAIFGVRHAAYGLPTLELVAWLKALIGDRPALEIGAGTGVLSDALGIIGTDNLMQQWPHIRAHYAALRQPVIAYGANVRQYDAVDAVCALKPKVVVASWVTHKYDPARHEAGGNEHGVVEEEIIRNCETYVVIGNTHVHRAKSVWSLPHTLLHPSWLYSRAHNGSREFIAVWGKYAPWRAA